MRGRPSKYSQEIAERICRTISTTSKSMRTIASEEDIDMVTIFRWLDDNEDFRNQYARAKELQADFLAEEMLDIADDNTLDTKVIKDRAGKDIEVEDTEWVNRSKLRIETRKWIASKLKPKKYGEKMENTNINIEQPLFPDVPKDDSDQ